MHDYSVPLPPRSYFIYAFCTWIGEAEHRRVQLHSNSGKRSKNNHSYPLQQYTTGELVMWAQFEMIPVCHRRHCGRIIENSSKIIHKSHSVWLILILFFFCKMWFTFCLHCNNHKMLGVFVGVRWVPNQSRCCFVIKPKVPVQTH